MLAARTERNKECDCFAVFILTHGSDSGKIFGTDKDILLSQLMEPLKNNDSLGGKPKMVFVQVCCSAVVTCHHMITMTRLIFDFFVFNLRIFTARSVKEITTIQN